MRHLIFTKTECFLLIAILVSGCMNTIPKEMVNEISKLPDKIDYNYHVKPILSDKCFVCHGPDAKNRKANLRLDFNEKFLKETDPQFQTLDDVKTEIPLFPQAIALKLLSFNISAIRFTVDVLPLVPVTPIFIDLLF